MIRRILVGTVLVTAAVLLMLAPVRADSETPGVTATEITIGNINPYSGPASAYGKIGRGIGAYFKMVNEHGGINGRKINYITYDDGYSPPKTMEQARRLVEQDKVLLIFQSLGTPTNSAIHQYMNSKKVPQLFVATGASKWGDPKNFPWTMGWQPSYKTEAQIYAKYVLEHVPNAKVGILYQNDDYGRDYVDGFKGALGGKAKSLIVAEYTYEATDPTVDSQVTNLKNSGANVFFDITGPKQTAQALRKAADIGWKPVWLLNNVSISIKSVLEPAGLDNAKGVISSTYGKEPDDPQWEHDAGMNQWRKFMAEYNPEGNIHDDFNVYAYGVAMTLEHVLKACGNDLSRANVMKQAASLHGLTLPTLLPGITIDTGPDDFYPIQAMQLIRFNGKSWERFGGIIKAN